MNGLVSVLWKYPQIVLAAVGFLLILAAIVGKATLGIEVDLPPLGRVVVGVIGACMLAVGVGWWVATRPEAIEAKANVAWGVAVGLSMILILLVGAIGIYATRSVFLPARASATPTWTPVPTPTPTSTATSTPVPTPAPMVRIMYPRAGARVRGCETVSGDFLNVSAGQHLWIAVYPPDYQYYVQREPTVVWKGEGKMPDRWKVTACFGGSMDVGQDFAILALLSSEEATRLFTKYVEKAIETGDWRGVPWLPKGTDVYDSVVVTRGNE